MGLFTPTYMKTNIQEKDMEKLSKELSTLSGNQLLLIAKSAPERIARIEAIRHIKDQADLLSIALNSSVSRDERSFAIGLLSDEAAIEKIVLEENIPENLRLEALNRIKMDFTLADIVLKSKNPKFMALALSKITVPHVLQQIVDEASDIVTRFNAMEKLGNFDQNFLAEISCAEVKDKNEELVRAEASDYISDQELLYDVAVNGASRQIRSKAFSKLHSEELLSKIVMLNLVSEENDFMSIDAVRQLDDQQLLESIVQNELLNTELRKLALGKISSQTVLVKLLCGDPSDEIRASAVPFVQDKDVLLRAAEEDSCARVRVLAAAAIESADILTSMVYQLAESGEDNELLIFAMKKLAPLCGEGNAILIFNNTDNPELRDFIVNSCLGPEKSIVLLSDHLNLIETNRAYMDGRFNEIVTFRGLLGSMDYNISSDGPTIEQLYGIALHRRASNKDRISVARLLPEPLKYNVLANLIRHNYDGAVGRKSIDSGLFMDYIGLLDKPMDGAFWSTVCHYLNDIFLLNYIKNIAEESAIIDIEQAIREIILGK